MDQRRAGQHVCIALLSLAASGCDLGGGDLLNASPYLSWPRALTQPGAAGRVVVLPPRNARPPDKGGTAPRSIGNVRAEAGIPYSVNAQTDDEIPSVIARLIGDAAGSSGVAVVAASDGAPTALIQTDIAELWCDGYSAMFVNIYKSSMTLNVHVQDPATHADRMMVSVHSTGGGKACGPAVQQMLGKMVGELTTALSAPAVRAGLVAGGGPAPAARAALVGQGGSAVPAPPAAPAAITRCGAGACKHGRVCSEGTCVDPR